MSAKPEMTMPDFLNRRSAMHYTTALNILIKLGLDINKINLIAVGEFENYKGEIREQSPAPGEPIDGNSEITLKIGFPSAVDYMPYQFFYGLKGVTSYGGQWEDQSRELMAPFDSAVIRNNAITRYFDLKNNFSVHEIEHIKKFLAVFNFVIDSDETDRREILLWASLFPDFHRWAGNTEKVCLVLKSLFGYEFIIEENTRLDHEIPKSCRYKLGSKSDRLGKEMIIGKSFSECDYGYEIVIKNVTVDEVVDLMPGCKKRKKIERAMKIFMPGNYEYSIKIETVKKKTKIGVKDRKYYLGYTSHL